MKKLTLLLILLFSYPIFTSAQLDSTLRLMTFNIRYPNPDDGFNYWPNRKELVYSMISFHKADIVGVQEAFRSQLDEITQALPELEWFGVCRTDGSTKPNPDNEFSAILYRSDKVERLDGATFWLSPNPEEVGKAGWDAALPRIATWAKFKNKATQQEFFVFNTHFDHRGATARTESARLMLQKINEIAKDKAVVLLGDFNVRDHEPPYKVLTDEKDPKHVKDALYISASPHHGPLGTWTNSFQFPGVPGARIDYIFIKNNVRVKQHAILSDSWSGRLPSDHLPVLVEIEFK